MTLKKFLACGYLTVLAAAALSASVYFHFFWIFATAVAGIALWTGIILSFFWAIQQIFPASDDHGSRG